MKKITLLLVFIVPFFGTAQVWDFSSTNDTWSELSKFSAGVGSSSYTLTCAEGETNPIVATLTAGVTTAHYSTVTIVLKNSNALGPEYLRFSYPQGDGSGRTYKNIDITKGDIEFKSYSWDISSGANWSPGVDPDFVTTINDLKLHFKAAGNSTFTSPAGGCAIEIDRIYLSNTLTHQDLFEFTTDADAEGWEVTKGTMSVGGGDLSIQSDVLADGGKIKNNEDHIFASDYDQLEVSYLNTSANNNEIRFQFTSNTDGFSSFKGTNESITTAMAPTDDYATAIVSLSGVTEWTGVTEDFQIILRNTANDGNDPTVGEPLLISNIKFSQSATASVSPIKAASEITIYPNPVNNIFQINAEGEVTFIEVYDLVGKKVLASSQNSVNVSALNTGMYLAKITFEEGASATKQFYKK